MARNAIAIQFRDDSVSNSAQLVISGNYNLIGWNLIAGSNDNAYLKLYNSATAAGVSVGTTTPRRTLLIPANGTTFLSDEDQFQLNFTAGIVIAVTGGLSDSNSAAPVADAYIELLYFPNP